MQRMIAVASHETAQDCAIARNGFPAVSTAGGVIPAAGSVLGRYHLLEKSDEEVRSALGAVVHGHRTASLRRESVTMIACRQRRRVLRHNRHATPDTVPHRRVADGDIGAPGTEILFLCFCRRGQQHQARSQQKLFTGSTLLFCNGGFWKPTVVVSGPDYRSVGQCQDFIHD